MAAKISLNELVVDLAGKPVEDGKKTYGRMLAELLSYSSTAKGTQLLKFWDWAQRAMKGEELVLDKTDQDMLISHIENHDAMTVFSKMRLVDKLKEEVKKSDVPPEQSQTKEVVAEK